MDTRKFHISAIVLGLLLAFWSTGSIQAASEKQFTVVIDAGHGGHDPGAIGRRGKEKNINLNVALKLGRMIENSGTGTQVVYTRKTDKFVPLHRRAEIANGAKADLFISIHTNSIASKSSRISGTETYTLGLYKTQENLEVAKKENSVILIEDDYKQRYAGFNPNSSESYIIFEFLQDKYMSQSVNFARMIQRQFRQQAKRIDKGVHQAGFLVLRETSMPSVLVELGYITNPAEETYLLSENGTEALARSVYQAFLEFRRQKGMTAAILPAAGTETVTPAESAAGPVSVPAESGSRKQGARKKEADAKQTGKPVFKIQILTSGKVLPKQSRLFKGLSPVSYYKENGIYKYTYAESTDYNHILRIKRGKVSPKFKDAFIIAFKNGEKMNINQAIKEFKNNR